MEDMQDVGFTLSPVASPGTPEALQAPTRQASRGFMWQASTIPLLFIGYCLVELFANCSLAALVATIPDQVPENQRGTVSGIFGLATGLGGILGAILAGQIFKSAPTNAYVVMFMIVLVGLVLRCDDLRPAWHLHSDADQGRTLTEPPVQLPTWHGELDAGVVKVSTGRTFVLHCSMKPCSAHV